MTKHFGAICDPGTSHIMTMAAIGRQLMDRGHRVTLFQTPDVIHRASALGIKGHALAASHDRTGDYDWNVTSGNRSESIKGFLSYAIRSAAMLCEQAPAAFREVGIDCVLADLLEPGAACAAERAGVPFVTICSAIPLHRDPALPPDFLPWSYSRAWWAPYRNRLAYGIRDLVISRLHRVLNGYRRQWGLRAYRSPEDSCSPLAQISQMVPEFDLPRTTLPPSFHYVGPYCRESLHSVPFPYERLNGRRIVYASLGTGLGRLVEVWQAIAEACSRLDVQLVIALGRSGLSEQMPKLAGDPVVVDYSPQRELLKRSTLFVTHAGLNSAMESLAAGIPMVAIPIMGDQFGVAARIEFCGAGVSVKLRNATGEALGSAISQMLADPGFRNRAVALSRVIQRTRGAVEAADIAERVIATGKPVLSL